MKNKSAIILAAGKGTRMKSDKPKVLCEVLFKPMIHWVTDACRDANIENICVVTGYKGDMVKDALDENIEIAVQEKQLGTGHAVMMAKDFLEKNIDGDVLVLCGDAPFMDSQTIEEAYTQHINSNNSITVITARLENPHGYGRIIRKHNSIEQIVEQKDASESQLLINEVNSGAYWFNVRSLMDILFDIDNSNAQGEYYLPDTVALSIQRGMKVGGYISKNPNVVMGANSRAQLLSLNELASKDILEKHMANGVEFINLSGVIITPDVEIGRETTILPGTVLKGKTKIGESCVIGPNSLLEDCSVGNEVVFNASQGYKSSIENNVHIGPFSHIRPNSCIKNNVHIGDFVEVKNSEIGEGTHISHLTYVGDSDVGKNVNFGCGVATANYDGKNKNRCKIGDNAFIGCNTNLIAPVTVGEKGYTAAGSTITDNVPNNALAIARARQINKDNYNK